MLVIILVTIKSVFSGFSAENCFLISRPFLHSCDKTARIESIDQVFTDLSMLILVYFHVYLLMNIFYYIFRFYVLKYIIL